MAANYNPAGDRIVTASADRTARVWDARTGTVLFTLQGHEGGVLSASYNPTGDRILTAGDDGTARVWDAQSGAEVLILHWLAGWGRVGQLQPIRRPDHHGQL